MAGLLDTYFHQLVTFLLVLTRVGGVILSAPIFGPRHAPLPARVLVAVALSLIVTPLYAGNTPAHAANLLQMTILVAREAAIGLALGLALTIFFSSMQLAGNTIGQLSGMQLADVFDPTFDTQTPLFGQLLDLVAITVFVALDGHRKVIAALLDTFRWRPPGGDDFPASIAETLSGIATESFVVGIRTGAPVMISLLLAVLVLGLISRTLPQLNVFAVGFNLNSAIALVALSLSLGTVGAVVEERADVILAAVRDAIR
jgi:flagellar biosynthetic protein FliR